jgi:hypothetical protein
MIMQIVSEAKPLSISKIFDVALADTVCCFRAVLHLWQKGDGGNPGFAWGDHETSGRASERKVMLCNNDSVGTQG